MKYINVKPGSNPGVEVHDGVAYCKVAGEPFPITAFIDDSERGYIPLLEISQITDDQWNEMTREQRARRELL